MRRLKRIAAVVESGTSNGRAVLRGLAAFAATQDDWELLVEPWAIVDAKVLLQYVGKADGIVTSLPDRGALVAVAEAGIPNVMVGCRPEGAPGAYVDVDSVMVGRLAGEHFLDRGYHFAGVYGGNSTWDMTRSAVFEETLRVKKVGVSRMDVWRVVKGWTMERQLEAVREWVRELAKPAAIFATCDTYGMHVMRCCMDEGIRVPEDVAILGVNNDEVLCEVCSPPMSSVDMDWRRMGFDAANVLNELMNERGREAGLQIAPAGVVTRRSTDILAIEDAVVASAVRFIHGNIGAGINVPAVVTHVDVSRRRLELGFRKVLDRTIHAEIIRSRVDRARRILLDTGLPIPDVAERSGFRYASDLAEAFRREMGVTPTAFRKANRR